MRTLLPYALRQLLWMLKSAFQLMYLMSTGIFWVFQMLRMYVFGGLVWIFFLSHWWWYLTSANVIRRVSYRSSRTTRRRNLLKVLEAEGVVDIPSFLKKEQRARRQQQIRAALGSRKRPFPSPRSRVLSSILSSRPPSTSPAGSPTGAGPATVPRAEVAGPAAEVSPTVTPLERLLRDSDRFSSVNPADGTVLRSLPLHPPPAPHNSPAMRPSPPLRSDVAPLPSLRSPQPARRVARHREAALPPPLAEVAPVDGDRKTSSSSASGEAAAAGQERPARGGGARRTFAEGTVSSAPAPATAYEDALTDDDFASADAAGTADPLLPQVLAAFPPRQAFHDSVETSSPPQQPLRPRRRRPPPPATAARAAAPSSGAWTDGDEEDEEDRLNLHNRATVDIVLPVPLDLLMKSLDYAKKSSKLRRKKFPVVIDVSGGAWIIGSHLWSTMLARVLAQRGYVVFCPDYRNFPQTTMEGMTLDVSDAIAWVLNNAERYNGDLNDVTLMGQSAGAHLTMMSLLSQAHLCAYEAAKSTFRDGAAVPPPSDVAYNVPRYNPRQRIHRYVGLSGIYNIERLVPHFHRRGLNAPVLQKIAGGRALLPRFSVHAYFDRRRGGDTGEVLPDNFFDFLPQKMFFLHGDKDTAAPVTESSSLVGVLRQAQMEFTLRRLTRNEEIRRHAYRSRGVLPGALSSPSNSVASQLQMPVDDPACDSDEGDGRQWSRPPPLAASGTKNYFEDGGAPAQDPAATASARLHRQLSLSPIVPPSRSDLPLAAVELEFILIPNATHTDAIVEECIVAQRSCCADFITDYLTVADGQSLPVSSPVLPVNSPGNGCCSSSSFSGHSPGASTSLCPSRHPPLSQAHTPSTTAAGAALDDADAIREILDRAERWSRSVAFCVPPDGILPMAVPPEDRPKILNWITSFCPF